jgi:hypothetical protein
MYEGALQFNFQTLDSRRGPLVSGHKAKISRFQPHQSTSQLLVKTVHYKAIFGGVQQDT